VAKQTEWLAVLEIDGQMVKKAYVGAAGTVSDKPSQKARPKKRAPSGPAGLFNGLVGEKEEAEEEKIKKELSVASTELTAEWIEFEIYSPGQQRYVERREIFDFIGPAMRRGEHFKELEVNRETKVRASFQDHWRNGDSSSCLRFNLRIYPRTGGDLSASSSRCLPEPRRKLWKLGTRTFI
jgi:hypothetical protein